MDCYRHCPLAAVSRREIGIRQKTGDTAGIQHSLASSIKVHHTWDPRKTIKDTDNGGVFNFDFSKDGSILGVACERKSVLLFDPFNGKLVATKYNAHTDCVNCVKFLDDRMFATCSDDTTVALWDVRYLKHTVQVFRGHSNWVKNIEYDAGGGRLVTSGFDGCIYTWDINRYNSENRSNRVFYTSGLMRSKLFPDASKLLISTHEGYIIVIHDLDLSTLDEDLKGFKPNMYRLMQRTKTPLRIGLMYNHVFEQKRNRVEFISDWPTGNDANIISSLQVHPQGWCIASRNTDSSENTEWTCVHEIQDDFEPEKRVTYPWEAEAPHTSSSYCSSTNTPAYSSVAPSNLHHIQQLISTENSQSSSSTRSTSSSSDRHRQQSRSLSGNTGRGNSVSDRPGQNRAVRREPNRVSDEPTQRASSSVPASQGTGSNQASNTEPSGSRQVEEAPSSGRVHNALIQIRRGPRGSDGNFSLSISVHTASGRTIEFNHSELESEDEDNEYVIEQIISGADTENDSRSAELQRQYFTRLIQGNNTSRNRQSRTASETNNSEANNSRLSEPERSTQASALEDSDTNSDNDGDVSDSDNDGISDNENDVDLEQQVPDIASELEVGLEVGNNDNEFDLSDDELTAEDSQSEPSLSQQLFRAAVGVHPPDLQQEYLDDMRSAQEDLLNSPVSRATTQSSTTESVNEGTRVGIQEDNDSDEESDTETANVPTVNSYPQPAVGSGLDSRSRTNTVTFLIGPNQQSGERRRRVVNLSYMDSYTERENGLLQAKIHTNKNRLRGYMEECNLGRGFIKELAFSSDGRLISSPFGFGFRIFAFDSYCNELCDCVPASPVKLYEVTCSLGHVNCVVATKFSPTHNLVVSGCLDGKIAFHQPVL